MAGVIKKGVNGQSFTKDWAVFACKDDTLYRVPKAHNRATTYFFITRTAFPEAHFKAYPAGSMTKMGLPT